MPRRQIKTKKGIPAALAGIALNRIQGPMCANCNDAHDDGPLLQNVYCKRFSQAFGKLHYCPSHTPRQAEPHIHRCETCESWKSRGWFSRVRCHNPKSIRGGEETATDDYCAHYKPNVGAFP